MTGRIAAVAAGLTAFIAAAWCIQQFGFNPNHAAPAEQRSNATEVTTVSVTNEVVQARTKRIGMNLGGASFWDASMTLNNLAFRNPGFEGLLYQSTVRCKSGTATTCTDSNPGSAWPKDFWSGANYEIFYGASGGRRGIIAYSTQAASGQGGLLRFADSGEAPRDGDYLILRKHFSGNAQRGWWTDTTGGARLFTEFTDLPPGSSGKQALRITADGSGQRASVVAYFDTSERRTFIQLKGSYRLTFSAKGLSGSNGLAVSLNRGGAYFLSQNAALSPAWKTYTLRFDAAENGSSLGAVCLKFEIAGASILIDDVSLEQTDRDLANLSGFRDPVVAALRAFRPGLLRHWVGQLGDSIDNMISPPGVRTLSGFSAGAAESDQLEVGLHEFLELCKVIGAEPWVVVPIVVSPGEAADLVEYLAGPATSPYGARRVARGQVTPWTSSFPKIHLEFGNEAWNTTFNGGTILDAQAYGSRAQEIFGSMRSSAWFQPDRFDLIAGGQSDWAQRNHLIQNACNNNDSFAVAPYQMNNVDAFATDEDLFGPLFAEPERNVTTGIMAQNRQAIQSSKHPVPLSVYELNLSTFGGTASQAALDRLTSSLGAGLAVTDHMLLMLEHQGVVNQLLWNLSQFSFQRSDGKTVHLFGSVIDMGVTDRRRPQFLAAQLLNEVLGGAMLRTRHSGADPMWNQPRRNGVELKQAHYLHSFAFATDVNRSLVLFNLHRSAPLPVTLTNITEGTVSMRRLTSNSPGDTNEDVERVRITSPVLSSLTQGEKLLLPPASLTVLTWTIPAAAASQISSRL